MAGKRQYIRLQLRRRWREWHGRVDLRYSHRRKVFPSPWVTGISGTFSGSNNGLDIVSIPIGPLEPIKHDMPDGGNLLAPHDFSRFAVTAGLPAQANGFLTYDNLFYPGGSPPTATDYHDYQVHGGFLDIYGLLFDIGGGRVVGFWSNGDFSGTGTGPIDYGAAVATSATSLDYVAGGVFSEPRA